mgnify:CR=1 FL=1
MTSARPVVETVPPSLYRLYAPLHLLTAAWFRRLNGPRTGVEARRVYAALGESDEDRDRRRLVEWIEPHGGGVTVRELTQGFRQYRGTTDAAREALDGLEKAGFGQWVRPAQNPNGGRPSPRFELGTGVTVTETPADDAEKAGLGSGGGGDGSFGGAAATGDCRGTSAAGNNWGELRARRLRCWRN